ncbi:MAG TPA: preprotein translocase subunit SecE [Nevskiaceae bacterium]|nr:preprotein translocase subunit SecE [Nevskiaceae bacterium]
MADSQESEIQKTPRRIRKVDSVREKAEKTTAANDRPKRRHVFATGFMAPLRLMGSWLAPLGRFKAVRIIGLILVPPYFRNSWKELRQVTWPTGRESRRLTLAVIIFALIFGALVALIDYGLDKVFKQVLLK